MTKIYVTREISPLFRRILQKLSFFNGSSLLMAAERGECQHSSPTAEVKHIGEYEPTLVITRNQVVARGVVWLPVKPKVVLLHTREHDTYEKFWQNAFDLDVFMKSSQNVLEIR